jgi:hypothetical protein
VPDDEGQGPVPALDETSDSTNTDGQEPEEPFDRARAMRTIQKLRTETKSYKAALRELADLQIGERKGNLHVHEGKEGADRDIPLNNEAHRALRAYLQKRPVFSVAAHRARSVAVQVIMGYLLQPSIHHARRLPPTDPRDTAALARF